MERFTNEELNAIVGMCSAKAAKITFEDIRNGKKPSDNPTYQLILSISNKAYYELIDSQNA